MNAMEGHKITTIPAKKKKYTGATRAAIYCRVSSAKKAQIESLTAQISALTSQIAYRPDYVLVDIYIDVASGSTLQGRPGFQRMLKDCENGKIQYIITKSISRFSRDIVIALEAIRKCREFNVPIYFESENRMSDEPLIDVELTAHLAVAEQDNLSRSDNINWGLSAGALHGTSKLYNRVCFGYKHDKNGDLVINEKEADIVRYIFRLYLDGYSILGIISQLKFLRINSPSGKETWNKHYLEKMISNVKYAGDVALKVGENTYLYSDHHQPIISRDAFDAAQAQKRLRSNTVESSDGTTYRKRSKYSAKKVLRETFDRDQFIADLGLDMN